MKAHIRKTIIGFNKKNTERVIHELGVEGIIHVGAWDTSGTETPPVKLADLEKSTASMLLEIEGMLEELRDVTDCETSFTSSPVTAPTIFQRNIESDRNTLAEIRGKIKKVRDLRQLYTGESQELNALLADAWHISQLVGDPARLMSMTLCTHVFGTVQKEIDVTDRNHEERYYIRQSGNYVLGMSPPGYRDDLIAHLQRYGFENKDRMLDRVSASSQAIDELRNKTQKTRKALDSSEALLSKQLEEIISWLAELHETYTTRKTALEAQKDFLETEDTVFISGWIDREDSGRLASVLERVCGNKFFLHIYSREEMVGIHASIPVRLRNLRFFKAFELIVKTAGTPGSRELDPTPIATIAYLLMFGVMFGDIGQGLTLSLTGFIMKVIAQRKKLRLFFHDAGTILIAVGLSATVFGALYGCMFCNEHILPALWFHPMEHIMDLFFATIMMGASFISLGLIMNIINLYNEGNYFEAIFGIHGILGFIVYSGSLFLAVRYIKADIPPGNLELLLIILLPIGLFLFRNIPGSLFLGQGRMYPHGIFEYFMESFVELMEMFSGFLGNSISFIRAGAFALSHAGLSIAVYTLAGIAGPALSVASISIIITGNLFIILLEGLVCGIQSMRLEYYEFFSKFYRGDGIEFIPFSFKRKQAVTKGVA